MLVKILPCPKLRLRVVKSAQVKITYIKNWNSHKTYIVWLETELTDTVILSQILVQFLQDVDVFSFFFHF